MKKAISMILATLLLFVFIQLPTVNAATAFDGGTGTLTDPFLISTPDQLNAIRNYMSSCFRLTKDIDVSTIRSKNWLPIGMESKPFRGNVDGAGHFITGLYINRTDLYCGLFGYMQNAVIHQINLANVNISGGAYTGGIVGYAVLSNIDNCTLSGSIIAALAGNNVPTSAFCDTAVGGICGIALDGMTFNKCSVSANIKTANPSHYGDGFLYFEGGIVGCCLCLAGDNVSTLSNCDMAGKIENQTITNPYIGGITGAGGIMTKCHSSGDISTITCTAGGITGKLDDWLCGSIVDCNSTSNITGVGRLGGIIGYLSNSFVKDSYFRGNVSGSSAGGFAGEIHNSRITHCYSLGDVNGNCAGFCNTIDDSSMVSDCFWLSSKAEQIGVIKGSSKGIRRIGEVYNTYIPQNSTIQLQTDFDFFPVSILPIYSKNASIVQVNSDGSVTGISIGSTFLTIQVSFDNESYTFDQKFTVGGDFPNGSGTQNSPYIINDYNGLQCISKCLGGYYQLASDIDLLNAGDWTPVGNVQDPFFGGFDGGGHIINGLTISQSDEGNVGLFGYASNADIRNLNITDALITYGNNSGGLVGYMNGGNISDCSATGQITTSTSQQVYSGMLVGYMAAGSMTNCYAIGDVASYYAGVFAGYMGGTMENCYWYNSEAEKGIAQGTGTNLDKINVNPDSLFVGQVVQGSASPASGMAHRAAALVVPTTNFKLYGKPSGIVFVASSNSSVVSITNDKLKALKAGQAIITIKFIYTNKKAVSVDYKVVVLPSYTVTFNSQGGSAVVSIVCAQNKLVTAPPAPVKKGFAFKGWYRQAACTTVWNFSTDKVIGNTILYAKWTVAPKVAIAVQTNGAAYGSVIGGGSYFNDKVTQATVTAAPKPGYRFVRWLEGTTAVSASYKYSFLVTKARTLKAEFAKIGIPTINVASAGYSQLKISWAAVAGATQYEIYRAPASNGTYTKVSASTGTTYIDTGLTTNKAYYYKVRVKYTAGTVVTYGAYSAVKFALPIPATPTGVKAVRVSATSIKITWGAVAGATQYEMWRCTTSYAGTYSLLMTTANAYYTNTGLTAGKTYWYKVRAYRLVGSTKVYGDFSTVIYAKT